MKYTLDRKIETVRRYALANHESSQPLALYNVGNSAFYASII